MKKVFLATILVMVIFASAYAQVARLSELGNAPLIPQGINSTEELKKVFADRSNADVRNALELVLGDDNLVQLFYQQMPSAEVLDFVMRNGDHICAMTYRKDVLVGITGNLIWSGSPERAFFFSIFKQENYNGKDLVIEYPLMVPAKCGNISRISFIPKNLTKPVPIAPSTNITSHIKELEKRIKELETENNKLNEEATRLKEKEVKQPVAPEQPKIEQPQKEEKTEIIPSETEEPAPAAERYKPVFDFSLSGGNRRGMFAIGFEGLYFQRWNRWFIQTSAMANANENIKEYGISSGFGYKLTPNVELSLFADSIYFPGQGFHGQIRPNIRFIGKRYYISAYYAEPFTGSVLLEKNVSNPFFHQDAQAYYYDIVTQTKFAQSVHNAGAELTVVPTNFLRLYADGILAQYDMYRIRAGVEVKVFPWLSVSGDWTKMSAEKALGFNFGGKYQVLGAHLNLLLGDGKNRFADLRIDEPVTPRYPVVITKTDSVTETKKISDILQLEFTVSKTEVYIGEQIFYQLKPSGGLAPLRYEVNFHDDSPIETTINGEHSFSQPGIYCIEATVFDSAGHSATQCVCVNVIKQCLPAKILSFTAEKEKDPAGQVSIQCYYVILSWTTENAQNVYLNNEPVALNGTKKVELTKTTTFTLRAKNDCPSEDVKQVTVWF